MELNNKLSLLRAFKQDEQLKNSFSRGKHTNDDIASLAKSSGINQAFIEVNIVQVQRLSNTL